MKRKLPDTSLSAYEKAKPMLSEHHAKIIAALEVLGVANYETIAAYCKMDRHQIGRRLSELERALTIFKPGSKTPTKSGRMAYDYCLTTANTVKTEKQIVYRQREKTAADYANDLIASVTKPLYVPGKLF